MATTEKAVAKEINATNNGHNDKVFNDDDDDFKAETVSPDMLAEYDDFSEDSEETAFGTTVPDDAYMSQFKRHNHDRSMNINTNAGLLSPAMHNTQYSPHQPKYGGGSGISTSHHHVKFSPSTINKDRSLTDQSQVHAMAQGKIIHK